MSSPDGRLRLRGCGYVRAGNGFRGRKVETPIGWKMLACRGISGSVELNGFKDDIQQLKRSKPKVCNMKILRRKDARGEVPVVAECGGHVIYTRPHVVHKMHTNAHSQYASGITIDPLV